MAIEQFDTKTCKEIAAKIRLALRGLEEEYGVTVKIGGGKYDPVGVYTPRLEISLRTEKGEAMTPEAAGFLSWLPHLKPLEKEDLFREFEYHGQRVRFLGWRSRARKRPMVYRILATGKMMVTSEGQIIEAICRATQRPMGKCPVCGEEIAWDAAVRESAGYGILQHIHCPKERANLKRVK